ncbi:hypothetical protein GCM10019016_105400 [Streptomyces prasinosporus]|uniref:Uncharacterized protein n=1 Tax=Streptomyces prasinosporus TaxID=68256 RepID=A0ABP6U8D3_9ACTN
MLAGTAACTSDGDAPTAEATADTTCQDGTCSWFNVDERDVLTGVAEKEKIDRKGARLTRKPGRPPRDGRRLIACTTPRDVTRR